MAFCFHTGHSRQNNFIHRALVHIRRYHRSRAVCAHTAGIRAFVVIQKAFMVLTGCHRQNMIAVHHNDKARFLALQEIFNYNTRACIAHFVAQQHIVDSGMGFIQSHGDNHAFTGSQTIRLNNNRRTFSIDVIMCRIGIFKGLVLRGWNLIFCHKCFSKIF